jgi:uncharacterized protein involved in exopolysaccharide biosynthesis
MQKMNLEVLKIVYKKRRYILYSALIGLIASIVIALVITPKYKSSGVIYSSNLLSNRGILFSNDILSNNEATNTELLMQFINSNEINLEKELLSDFMSRDSAKLAETKYNTFERDKRTNTTKTELTTSSKFKKNTRIKHLLCKKNLQQNLNIFLSLL